MNWGSWQGCYGCSGSVEPGTKALLAWLLESYPQGKSLGIYNCRDVAGTGTLSIHSCGRALDYWLPYVNGGANPVGHDIVRRIGEHGQRLGIQAIIFDRKIWSQRSPEGRLYTGVHPHYDHLHIEQTQASGDKLTLATLRSVLGGPEENPMFVNKGSRGPIVREWQDTILYIDPTALPEFGSDGSYGGEMEAAVKKLTSGTGARIGLWEATELQHLYLAKRGLEGPGLPSSAPVTGTLTGTVTFG